MAPAERGDNYPDVRRTTATVFDAITANPIGAFTTFDIAERMGVAEYPLRALLCLELINPPA